MATYYISGYPVTDELYHHGIKGQKWGIRRYQNEDGTLTEAGLKRYYGNSKKVEKTLNSLEKKYAYSIGDKNKALRKYDKLNRKTLNKYEKLTGKRDLFDGNANEITKKFEESGLRNSKKWKKIVDLQNRNIKDLDISEANVKKAEEKIWKALSTAHNQGYSVIGTPKYRQTVRNGEQFIGALLTGGLGEGIRERVVYGPGGTATLTNQYSVQKDKSGSLRFANR
jgi:predicted Fe-Mo cluster-binding NifX family protein